jgi:hypothetical protein
MQGKSMAELKVMEKTRKEGNFTDEEIVKS